MSDAVKLVRYGYKNISWENMGKGLWVSLCNKYNVLKVAPDTYTATKKILIDAKPSYLIYDDSISTDTLAKAKEWCNDNALRDYLHWLQVSINETNRYGE